jgi:cytochrome c oxidase assembly protein subunit 15
MPGERPETVGVEPRAAGDPILGRLARLQLAMAGVVLLTGTVVTGTGPNSGDSRADRLGFELTTVARVHSVCVWMLLATVVVLSIRLVRSGHSGPGNSGPDGSAGRQSAAAMATGRWLLLALIAQGAVGYTQFALGVPAGLVELHILGAVVVWSLAIQFQLRLGQPIEPTAALGGDAATERELSAP